MDVKLLASQTFLEKINSWVEQKSGKNPSNYSKVHVNPERYEAFMSVFGDKDYGFVLAGDVQKEIRTGEKAQVYLFGKGLKPYKAEKGVDCKLFIASAFGCNGFPSREEVLEITTYLEKKKQEGKIRNIVNSKRGSLSEDKISILELKLQGIKVPNTNHFANFSELKYFLENNPGEYVVKHRFGQEGEDFFRINNENFGEISGINLKNFIVQDLVEILNEKRLIFFKDELIGSRIIYDRHMPWEEKGKVEREHITKNYYPTPDEINDSRRILRHFDATVGAIDWIETNQEKRMYMEYNGIGTGWGMKDYQYNLNKTVAEKLKKKYLG